MYCPPSRRIVLSSVLQSLPGNCRNQVARRVAVKGTEREEFLKDYASTHYLTVVCVYLIKANRITILLIKNLLRH